MGIVLFALIGAHINAGLAYWLCFGVYCAISLVKACVNTAKEMKEK